MVNQSIVEYIKEGKKRGFSVGVLRKELVKGGFSVEQVEEAVRFLDGSSEVPVVKPAINNPEKVQNILHSPVSKELFSKQKPMNKIGGTRWIMAGGICGIILAVLIFAISGFGIYNYFSESSSDGVLETIGNGSEIFDNMPIVYFTIGIILVSTILLLIYLYGFIRKGNKMNSRSIKLSCFALAIITGLMILMIATISGYTYLKVSSASDGGLNAYSDLLGLFLTVMIFVKVISILTFVFSIGLFIFSAGLLREKEVKFSKVSGIFYLGSAILLFMQASFMSFILFFPESIMVVGTNSFLVSFVTILFHMLTLVVLEILFAVATLFGSLMLLKNK